MKFKKKIILIVFLIILIVLISFFTMNIILNNKKENGYEEILQKGPKQGGLERESIEPIEEETITIQSTEENKIERDEVEVKNINIKIIGNIVNVSVTLQNNSNETLNGYYIEIELLDSEGNVKAVLTDNSKTTINAGETTVIENSIMDIDNSKEITNARIKELSKNNVMKTFEKTMDEMLPDLEDIE